MSGEMDRLVLAVECPQCHAPPGQLCDTKLTRGYHLRRADLAVWKGAHADSTVCIICGEPVMCGQGRAHYSCLGMCQSCFNRPAAGPGYDHPDRCGGCQRAVEDWPPPEEPSDEPCRPIPALFNPPASAGVRPTGVKAVEPQDIPFGEARDAP